MWISWWLFIFLDGEETTLCHNCNKYANKLFRQTLCKVAFPEPDAESSIELELQRDSLGELMEGNERYACKRCNPIRTVVTRQRMQKNISLCNWWYFAIIEALIIIFKLLLILWLKKKLTTFSWENYICTAIYHIGDSPGQAYCVCAIKEDDTWYTCNDDRANLCVKLRCNSTIKSDLLIPYLLIYKKVHETKVPAMKVGQSERLTSKSIEAKNILNDINIFDTEEKAIN